MLLAKYYYSDEVKEGAMHAAQMGEKRDAYSVLVGNLKETGSPEDLEVNRMIR